MRKSASTFGDMANKNWEVLNKKGLEYEWMLGFLVSGVISFLLAFIVLAISVALMN